MDSGRRDRRCRAALSVSGLRLIQGKDTGDPDAVEIGEERIEGHGVIVS
jgi:hypothetical protein